MIEFFSPPLGRISPALQTIRRFDIAILLSIAAIIALYLWLSPIRVHNLTLEDSLFPEKGEFEIKNSYRPERRGTPERKLLHRVQFEHNALSQDFIHIRTIDCAHYARLNGKDLLPKRVSGDLCNDYKGAYFDISEVVVPGTNTLEIKTQHTRHDHKIYFGFDVSSANLKSPTYFTLVCLLFSIGFYLIFVRLIRSSLPIYALGILLVAILLRVYVASNTHALERSHDVHGHIEYMTLMIEKKSLPKSLQCWSCYHPPYFFASMATIKALLTNVGLTDFNAFQFLMLISVATYSICLYFAFLTIRRFFSSPGLQIFSMALFAFLPSSVIHSVAINNDLWMFTLFSVAFYYFVVWWQSKVTRFYYISLAFASLSLIVKASGIVMFGLLGFFALGYAISRHHDFLSMVKRFSPAVVIMAVALLFNPIVDKTLRPPSDQPSGGIIGNAHWLGGDLKLGNEARNYLYFNPAEFVNQPFVHPYDDNSGGRHYFWTALLKTALYGEFRDQHIHNEGGEIRKAIAPISSLAFLILLIFMIVHAFLMRRDNMTTYGPLYALIATCLTALIVMRCLMPFFPINDFRYIWSIMMAPCVLIPLAVDTCRERNLPMLSYFGYGAISISILVSIIFCLSIR